MKYVLLDKREHYSSLFLCNSFSLKSKQQLRNIAAYSVKKKQLLRNIAVEARGATSSNFSNEPSTFIANSLISFSSSNYELLSSILVKGGYDLPKENLGQAISGKGILTLKGYYLENDSIFVGSTTSNSRHEYSILQFTGENGWKALKALLATAENFV